MLNIEYEFKKGFFFVRLSGTITKNNYNEFIKELNGIITNTGLNKIVINIDNITNIEKNIHNKILKYINKKLYKGILILICDSKLLLKDDNVLKINYETETKSFI